MKLLECLDSTNPAHGGTVESTRQRSLALQSLGHKVELLTLDEVESPWIRKWPTPVHALGRGRSRFGYNRRVRRWIEKNGSNFDAIIVNGVWRYLGTGVRNGSRRLATPYFVVPHSMLNPWFQQTLSVKSISKVAMWRLTEWKVLRDARAVLFTCEEERRLASQAYRPYICTDDVLSLVGTSVPAPDRRNEGEMFAARFPLIRGKRLILYLSRLHPMKGCDLAIKAFSIVCSEDRDLNLVIAGHNDGNFGVTLRELADRCAVADRITWAGQLSDEMKWAALQSASLFALPSHCEAFPLALVEALGSGVPALITDKVNIWREVSDTEAGFVDSDTVEGTVRSLRRWLKLSESERELMRTNALRCFSEYFESKANAKRFVAGLTRHGVAE
jgi:glycosyltransferase involved in cell wall biosynthesis